MNYKSFNLTQIGASHIKNAKECQDYSMSYEEDDYLTVIVSDGHGGDDYVRSAAGSMLACAAAKKNIVSFIKNISLDAIKNNTDRVIEQLCKSIINGWNEAVFMHYEGNLFTEKELSDVSWKVKDKYLKGENIEEAYGTTLIAAVLTNDFWFGIQIGDGKCIAISEAGEFYQPIPWDDKCFLNATTSMCDMNALKHFRFYFSEDKPAAVFIGTDGVDDCFGNDGQLYMLYQTVAYSFGSMDFKEAVNELAEYLPRLTAKGSGDDISIAAIFNKSMIMEMDFYKELTEKSNTNSLKNTSVTVH